MASTIAHISSTQSILLKQKMEHQTSQTKQTHLPQSKSSNQIIIGSAKNPTELILQAAMDKINEVFKPYLGDGATEHAVTSNMDLSPRGTANHIMGFANHLIGKAELEQMDLPPEQQRSRAQLFQNIQTGIENGFAQAREILENIQALNGETKEKVDTTYQFVQEGLSELSKLLGLLPPEQTNV